jgi:hypothetical protein
MLPKPLFLSVYFAEKSKAQIKSGETNSPNLHISLTLIKAIKSMA